MDHTLTPQLILDRMPAKAAHFRIAQNARKSREKLRVLIVEDQPFSQKILAELLRGDYVVDVAADAKEGLNLYLEHAPDIAFLDIEMGGENGHTLARFLKNLDPTSYVVMVTGNNSVEDVALAKSNNVDGFIVKPYNKQKIFSCIDAFRTQRGLPKGTMP
jgi:CheY-like chemotaxis protein